MEKGWRQRAKEKAAGRNWARGADPSVADRIITEMVHGEFDWRDWFDRRPTSDFLDGAFEQLEHEELMRNAPRENPSRRSWSPPAPARKRELEIRADEIRPGDLLRGAGPGTMGHRWSEIDRVRPYRIPEMVELRTQTGYISALPRFKKVVVRR